MPELEVIEARVPARTPRLVETAAPAPLAGRLAPIAGVLKGPIFTRARDIIAANMNELLDRAEDPARMIRMVIVEMEETLIEVRATAASVIADMKELRGQAARLDAMAAGWTEKAELALSKDREDLARAALVEKGRIVTLSAQVADELGQIEGLLAGYEEDIRQLQGKLAEARARQSAIAGRIDAAASRARTNRLVHGSRTADAFARFEALERDADIAEAEAEALGMGGRDLDGEFAALKASEKVEDELDAMKAALAARAG